MIFISIVFFWSIFAIVWFFVSRKISKTILARPTIEAWIKSRQSSAILSKSIKIGMFLLPFVALVGFDKWKALTFPLVCHASEGYSGEPVKVVSILNSNNAGGTLTLRDNNNVANASDMLRYITLKDVQYVEWIFRVPYESMNGETIEAGNYRAQYYPVNASQCVAAENIIPSKDVYLEYSKQMFAENGFPLKNTNGMCLGVEKVNTLEAVYKIQDEFNAKESSRFGHSLNVFRTKLVNHWTGEVINSVQHVSTDKNMLAEVIYLFLYTPFKGSCNSTNFVLDAYLDVNKRLNVERGFFKFD